MPKLGMEPIRRQQLIDATLQSVAEHGFDATTINKISKRAGLSSGIISHYFGGKEALIEATVRHILTQLKANLLRKTQGQSISAYQRLMCIVETNFAPIQQHHDTTRTWLIFWAQSMHNPTLFRLQQVNSRRLFSNLKSSYRQLMPEDDAQQASALTAAMIDGLWLRCVLAKGQQKDFAEAQHLCKQYIHTLISPFGE
ncbi:MULTISPECIES: transcriptional regulator BetI [unclassified Vibrio]|uniref:HTH-type transcriptional regulator BetI n=1 Tax=Vibrio sp. HB236076 TaxID=3232307 RepID=A0AB39HIU0_9VIBR|nr:transcriptional regulator BetI [Vibrio sp. HB161653]MDP5255007.1 transcriptional regulator BetI [Vibrio sp. HB161653]